MAKAAKEKQAPEKAPAKKKRTAQEARAENASERLLLWLDPQALRAPALEMRIQHDERSAYELEKSIRRHGIINPISVAKIKGGWEVVAGWRRTKAARVVGMQKVPCIDVGVVGLKTEELKLAENEVRADVDRVAYASYLAVVKKKYKLTNRSLAELAGSSEQKVGQHLALLEWPETLLAALRENIVSFSAARELAKIDSESELERYLYFATESGCTPRLAQQWRAEYEASKAYQHVYEQAAPPDGGEYQAQVAMGQCFLCAEGEEFSKMQPVWLHPACRASFLQVIRNLASEEKE